MLHQFPTDLGKISEAKEPNPVKRRTMPSRVSISSNCASYTNFFKRDEQDRLEETTHEIDEGSQLNVKSETIDLLQTTLYDKKTRITEQLEAHDKRCRTQ